MRRRALPDIPRRLALLTAALVLLPGCVSRGDVRVAMKDVEADLVFGVTQPEELPPVFGPSGPIVATGEEGTGEAPLEDLSIGFTKPKPKIGAAQVPCPPAAANASPAQEAPRTAETLPIQGQYRFKKGGHYSFDSAPGVVIPYAGFENRLVRNVKQLSDSTGVNGLEFTFETVQPTFTPNQTLVSTWHLKAAPQASATPRQLQINGPNVGEPERGLALEKLEVRDRSGSTVSTYNFPTGVLYLPLPVTPGTQWSSAAVDPTSGLTLSMDGEVRDRERVDACGELVDGWRIKTTQTFSGTDNRTITYDYIVATGMGGLLVNEQTKTHTSGITAGQYELEYTLGQTKPDPLPAEEAQP